MMGYCGGMADAQTQLVKMNPDGTIGLTVDGTRHTLRQIRLGELRALRDLYNECRDEVKDYLDFTASPALKDARGKVTEAKTKAARDKARAQVKKIQTEQDVFVQGQWARWWRECIGTLSGKALPDLDAKDPAAGLEAWQVDSPASIGPLFEHWRSVPLEGSSRQDGTTEMLRALTVLGQDG